MGDKVSQGLGDRAAGSRQRRRRRGAAGGRKAAAKPTSARDGGKPAPAAAPALATPPAPASGHAGAPVAPPAVAPGTGAAKHPDAGQHAEVLVLGCGPGRLHRRLPRRRPRQEGRAGRALPALGGVCLNVGCIPSKALLHAAKVIADAEEWAHIGLSFGKPKIDLDGAAQVQGRRGGQADRRASASLAKRAR